MHQPSPMLLESFRPLRRSEYDRLVQLGVFEDERVELLAGVLTAMSPQGPEHADVVDRLADIFKARLVGRARVRAQFPLALSDESEPEPDVALVPLGDYRHEHPTRALLVIEVADSSLRKDRQLKPQLYAAAGVPEYWLVNLVDRVVEVHRAPGGDSYADVFRAEPGATIRPTAFPDVAVDVAALFA